MRTRRRRGEILLESSPANWPQPDAQALPPEGQLQYLRRKHAVELWLSGATADRIRTATGLSVRQARVLVSRAISLHPVTGRPQGYWVCMPSFKSGGTAHQRRQAFDEQQAKQGRGLKGALQNLFSKFPDIQQTMRTFIEKRLVAPGVAVPLVSRKKVHEVFLSACRNAGLKERGDWPFNTKKLGEKAIYTWFDRERRRNPVRAARNELGENDANQLAAQHYRAKNPTARNIRLAYERAELDEHHLDALSAIVWLDRTGGELEVATITRTWALAIRDVGSSAILSAGVSYGERYESPRELRRLHYLREWSHDEQIKQIFP